MGVMSLILLPIFLLGDFEYDYNDERSNRRIVLERFCFFIVDENKTEIASVNLAPRRLDYVHAYRKYY